MNRQRRDLPSRLYDAALLVSWMRALVWSLRRAARIQTPVEKFWSETLVGLELCANRAHERNRQAIQNKQRLRAIWYHEHFRGLVQLVDECRKMVEP